MPICTSLACRRPRTPCGAPSAAPTPQMRKSRMDPIDSGAPNRSKRSAFQGRLWNGNPSGDLTKAPRCGAKTRRGSLCQAPAMAKPTVEVHTVPVSWAQLNRTANPEGLERSRRARWKGGRYSEKRGMAAVPDLHSAVAHRTALEAGAPGPIVFPWLSRSPVRRFCGETRSGCFGSTRRYL